jgi:beta-lactamase superfamily II metal-dependent hydrolase
MSEQGTGAMPEAPAVRVRMYDVGFGDCFLVGFPGRDRERLVLIDCGVHSASRGKHKLAAVIDDVIASASAGQDHARIDVVVATHRHRDHVHGFYDQGRWADVEVGEVWLPWTEDPDDAEARGIKDRQSRRARLLLGLCPARATGAWPSIQALAENSGAEEDGYTNARAMNTLHRGFAGNPPRYYLPQTAVGGRSGTFETDQLPGVRIHLLGPIRDADAIRDMDPPEGEAYLAMGAGTALAADGPPLPFGDWVVSQDEFFRDRRFRHFDLNRSELGSFVSAGRVDALALAVSLEQAVNGTSLMFMFEYGDANLLFTGDAQWGTWARVLADDRQKSLLARANLFKVGHHGSHNATPKRFVTDTLQADQTALVSVAPTGIPSWSDIPRIPLLDALRERGTRVIRSDMPDDDPVDPPGAGLPTRVGPDGLWTEVRVPLRTR